MFRSANGAHGKEVMHERTLFITQLICYTLARDVIPSDRVELASGNLKVRSFAKELLLDGLPRSRDVQHGLRGSREECPKPPGQQHQGSKRF